MTNREEWLAHYEKFNIKDELVDAYREMTNVLRTENSRQRKLIGRLRKTVSDLRRLKNIQIQNDEAFREMCADVIVVDVT